MVSPGFPRLSRDRSANQLSAIWTWFERKQSLLLVYAAISIALLFILHYSATTMQVMPGSNLHKIIITVTIVLLLLVVISIIWKGIVPIAVCGLGLALSYAGILYPSYITEMVGEAYHKASYMSISERSVLNASYGYFLLGVSMLVFSIIIAYKPSILYTRNRPEPLDTVWQKYPIWYDNANIVEKYPESNVPLKSLMTIEEEYLSWRYEYILTDILGVPHLVKPDGYVPASSIIFRDKATLSMMGKAKYTGYFI